MPANNAYPSYEEMGILDSILEMEMRLARMRQAGQKVPAPFAPGEIEKEEVADQIEMGGGINIGFGEPVEAPRAWNPPMEAPLPPVDPAPQGPQGFNWTDIQRMLQENNAMAIPPVIPPS